MKENKGTANIAVSIFFGAVGTFVALLLVVFAGYTFLDLSFLPDASCSKDDRFVYCFFDEKWDSGTYLSVITGFYSTIITILIGLLGVIAAFAFFAIRGTAFQRAEESIEKQVGEYFDKTKAEEKIHKGLEKIAKVEFEKIKRRLDDIEEALKFNEILVDNLSVDDEEETKKAD